MDKQQREAQVRVDREAVKTLAIAVGVREAARQLGLNENTVVSWSKRDNWQITRPKPNGPPRNQPAIRPSDALVNMQNSRKVKIKTNLSKYLLNGSKVAARSRSPLEDAGRVKDLATVMEKVYPPESEEGSGTLSGLRVYSKQTVIQVDQR